MIWFKNDISDSCSSIYFYLFRIVGELILFLLGENQKVNQETDKETNA